MRTPDITHSDGPEPLPVSEQDADDVVLPLQQRVLVNYAGLEREGRISGVYMQNGIIEYLVRFDEETWAWINKNSNHIVKVLE